MILLDLVKTMADNEVIEISSRKQDRELVSNIKVGMIKNAIGLSDIGFMTYLNYLNITISMLYSFDVISKKEYDDLLKYLNNVDWYRVCKEGVQIMNKDLNCLQRPSNRCLLDEWENVRQLVIKGAKKSNVDLTKIFLVEEVKKY